MARPRNKKSPIRQSAAVHTESHQSQAKAQPSKFPPNSLVGNQPTVMAVVDGTLCECLMDTGSQVTCLSEAFYRQHLKHRPLEPLDDLMVVGASGSAVPYIGYTEIHLRFPSREAGVEAETTTLALITPTRDGRGRAPLLIGTNTSVV